MGLWSLAARSSFICNMRGIETEMWVWEREREREGARGGVEGGDER